MHAFPMTLRPSITAHPAQLAFAIACADVHLVPGGPRLGVAYLVRPDWAATAASVLSGCIIGQPVLLRFSGGARTAALYAVDEEADCALLHLADSLTDQISMPLLFRPCPAGLSWQTWAATPSVRSAGQAVEGLVDEPISEDVCRGPAMRLHAVSGRKHLQPELLGSPLLHNGKVIGHLRSGISDSTLLACPAPYIYSLLPEDEFDQPPPKAAYRTASYVARPSEEAQARLLLAAPRQPVLLSGPERQGKTWLLRRLLEMAAFRDQARVVTINLGLLSAEHFRDEEVFFGRVRKLLAGQLAPHVESYEKLGHGTQSARDELLGTLAHALVAEPARPLYLALDRIDSVHNTVVEDDVKQFLRDLGTGNLPGSLTLRLCLTTSTEPSWLLRPSADVPVITSEPIEILDLTDGQTAALAERYGVSADAEERAQLTALIGGQPFLWTTALYAAVTGGRSLSELLRGRSARLFEPFLEVLRRRIAVEPGLWPTLERILYERQLGELDRLLVPRLYRMGLVRLPTTPTGEATLRYPLYRRLAEL